MMKSFNINFFGTNVSVISQCKQIMRVQEMIDFPNSNYVTYTNVHVVVTSKNNDVLRTAINNAAIVSPDGMPLVKVAKWKKVSGIEKCSGPDMIIKIIEDGLEKGYKHYFYGSTTETLKKLKNELEQKYPTIIIVGDCSPPFRVLTDEEDQAIVSEINELNPDCIWVGLGAPKQELWMFNHMNKIKRGVMFGVGAAFDFHADTLKRAPVWMQEYGLEWFYRLIKEPKRLWKRYLVTNTLFIWYLIKHGVKIIKHDEINIEDEG